MDSETADLILEMELKEEPKPETQPNSQPWNFDLDDLNMVDFEMLLDKTSSTIGEAAETKSDSATKSESEQSKPKEIELIIPEKDPTFLSLLDDIFVNDKSMELVNRPLKKVDKLFQTYLVDASKNPNPMSAEDEKIFAKPKTFSCRYCDNVFYSRVKCHTHQVLHAKELLQCSWCGQQSRSNGALKRHIQYHHTSTSMKHVFF